MIRSVRRILLAVCNQRSMDAETLSTALIEVERILNNGPLTQVTSEAPSLTFTPNEHDRNGYSEEENFEFVTVLPADGRLRRDEWPLAVVEACLPDKDGLVRTVKVKTAAGETLRDVRRICYLEGEEAESTGNPSS
ncbi:unnamed protein product [Echinostoma caproni]|uniref:DUF5641 domain-containing protein n=1 Tax=Echinostoma caproni TaxID=27848 RepID=A0A183AMU8_9TREM|nr:unnamed protein product [Echinostoma caproni]